MPTTVTFMNGNHSERALEAFKRLGLIDENFKPVDKNASLPPPTAAPTGDPNEIDADKDLGPLPPGYVEPRWTEQAMAVLTSPMHSHGGIILRGMPGTSKTTGTKYVVRKLRRAGYRVELFSTQCFDGYSVEDIRGTWTIQDGKSEFVYGPLSAAVIYSAAHPETIVICQCEEANMARPGVWSWANTVCDGSGDSIFLPDGRSVRPTVGKIKLVLCYNEGSQFAGTREINRALYDRLVPIDTEYLPANQEAQAIHACTGLALSHCSNIVKLAETIRSRVEEHGFILSPRALIGFAYLRNLGWDWMRAFEAEIVARVGAPGTIPGEHRETIRQIALSAGVDKWN